MLRSAASAVARKVTGFHYLLRGRGRDPPPLPVVGITVPTDPPPVPQPIDARLASLDDILTPLLHVFRQHHMGNPTTELGKQLSEFRMRLLTLRAYTAETTEEIINDPRLDLKTLPLLTNYHVSEMIKGYISVLGNLDVTEAYHQLLMFLVMGDYIEISTSPTELVNILRLQNAFQKWDSFNLTLAVERYVKLCDEYCPSSSEVSKNNLLEMHQKERVADIFNFYAVGVRDVIFRYTIMEEASRFNTPMREDNSCPSEDLTKGSCDQDQNLLH